MFEFIDDVVDVVTTTISKTTEVATLGFIQEKQAKDLANKGWTIYQISQELSIAEHLIEATLKEK